jgi:hypothetical protein
MPGGGVEISSLSALAFGLSINRPDTCKGERIAANANGHMMQSFLLRQ